MTEKELQNLKNLPAPEPRAGAKAGALAAAMAAFDEPAKKNPDTPQGDAAPVRLTHASSETQRRRGMRVTPVFYKLAASIAVVTVGSVLVYRALPPQLDMPAVTGQKETHSEAPYAAGGRQFPQGNKLVQNRLKGKERERGTVMARSEASPAPVARPHKHAVEQGARIYVESINIVGNARTRDDVIRRELRLSRGDAYSKLMVDQARQRLQNLGFFKSVKLKRETGSAPDRVILTVIVEERATGELSLAGGYSSSESPTVNSPVPSESGRITVARREMKEHLPAQESIPMYQPQWRRAANGPDGGNGIIIDSSDARRLKLATPQDLVAGADGDVNYYTQPREENRDRFDAAAPNPVKQAAAEPVSTFSIDVDTASYAFMRRALNGGRLPPKDAVRVEEMINYFPYNYPHPESADAPFRPTVTVVPAPWNPANKLLHIGIKGYELKAANRPRANLVFLIDVSGSMRPADRLPLVKNAFRMLVEELKPDDTIGIVTYASGSDVALEPTRAAEKGKILAAIERLGAGGSTAGAQGLQDAYRLAETNFDKAAVNRVILATDGDFNVGITDKNELTRTIEAKRQTGIFLSILGVGQNNYNDALMQKLAQNGNGAAAYVDTLSEARKVLVDEASSTLFTIAKDVKIQIEFNPAQVSEYRLIGYETRALKREDFNNDKVDAGDIGSGHTVTAIYEVTPVGAPKFVDDLRYGKAAQRQAAPEGGKDGEMAFLKLRYKLPKEDVSKLITVPVTEAQELPGIKAVPEDVRFSVAVAAFGQILRGLPYLKGYSYDDVLALAKSARGDDEFGYRAEFLNLVRLAKSARP